MTTFVTDLLSFDVPEGFENRSLEAFVAPASPGRVSLSIAREKRREGRLEQQAEALLAQLPKALPASRILARRPRTIGALPGYEARVEAQADGASIYQRLAFVGHYDTLLVFTATSERAHRGACDRVAEAWIDSLRFRKR